LEKALAEMEEAQRLAPDDPVIAEHLGDVYAKSNLVDKALRMYELALKLDPKKADLKEKIKKLQNKKKRR
jgi:Flp pilus assembly protein TadD